MRILKVGACLLALAAGAVGILLSRLDGYVDSDAFREAIGAETAKGLHLASGSYQPIRREGLTAISPGFQGKGGWKAITAISTGEVTARFNPWGIFLRRWQLDDVSIKSGELRIETYVPRPEQMPRKPWFAFLLPDRVYLKQVTCDRATVIWRLRGSDSGFLGTRLQITPHGRDFEYRANGGVFKVPFAPEFELEAVHLLITKELMSLYDLDLATRKGSRGTLHLAGKTGLREDKSVDAFAAFEKLPIAEWLPESLHVQIGGSASGKLHWSGSNTKLETSSGNGFLRIEEASLADLPVLDRLATLTGEDSLRRLDFTECVLDGRWKFPDFEITNTVIEQKGKLRAEGSLSINRESLHGVIRLGAAPEYLQWLPKTQEIFKPGERGYLWTMVHLGGTLRHPEEDLSPRIRQVIEHSPSALFELFAREIGGWFEGK